MSYSCKPIYNSVSQWMIVIFCRTCNMAAVALVKKFDLKAKVHLERTSVNGSAHEYKDTIIGLTSRTCGF